MSLLYHLSNICIPILILCYRSICQFKEQNISFKFGRWVLLIWIIILFQFLSLFYDYFLLIFIDLIVKLAIVLMPISMNDKFESLMTNLHLEIQVKAMKRMIISKIYQIIMIIMDNMMLQMNDEQKLTFKNAIIKRMNNKQNDLTNNDIMNQCKNYEQIGINCTINNVSSQIKQFVITNESMNKSKIIKKQQQQQQYNNNNKNKNNNKKYSKLTNTNTNNINNNISLKQSSNFYQDQQEQQYKLIQKVLPRKKSTNNQKRLTNQLLRNKIENNNSNNNNIKSKSKSQIRKKDNFYLDSNKQQQDSIILEKLDIEVSEYSDMFESSEQQQKKKQLICKVEVIMQMMGTLPQLEIYYLELYNDSQLKIMSVYQRQFEKHKLISMKKLQDNYYQLKLKGGKINKRKIKFRGQAKPFMKYLNLRQL